MMGVCRRDTFKLGWFARGMSLSAETARDSARDVNKIFAASNNSVLCPPVAPSNQIAPDTGS